MKIYHTITCCLLLFSADPVLSQNHKLGAWNIINFKLNLDKQWGLFGEAQIRSQLFYDNFSYYEIKGGASYTIKKSMPVAVGAGRFITYSDGKNFELPYVNKEWRIWEQFALNNYIGRVKFENRVRIEQRWTTNAGYRNRLKYRLNTVVPINNKKIVPGTFYISGWDEVYFTNSDPHYEQNRIFGGVGYEVSHHLTLQSGYLHQVNYKADDTHAGKNYIQLSVLIETNALHEHHEKASNSAD